LAVLLSVRLGCLLLDSSRPALRAAGPNHSVTLTWTASTSSSAYPSLGYNVYRGTAAGGESAVPINSSLVAVGCSGATCTYTDTNVTPLATYYYEVAACVGTTCSAMSNEVSATIPLTGGDLAAPTGLKSTAQ
jgi:hypothetical protein